MSTAQRMIDQGEAKGKAATLARLVRLKFREVDDATLTRIANASAQELDLWTERILFAASLDELFRS